MARYNDNEDPDTLDELWRRSHGHGTRLTSQENKLGKTQWMNPTFTNGFVNAGGIYDPFSYRIFQKDKFQIRGVLDVTGSTGTNSVVTTVLEPFRPPSDRYVFGQVISNGEVINCRYQIEAASGYIIILYPWPPIPPWQIKVTADLGVLGAQPVQLTDRFIWDVPFELQGNRIVKVSAFVSTPPPTDSSSLEVTIRTWPGLDDILIDHMIIENEEYNTHSATTQPSVNIPVYLFLGDQYKIEVVSVDSVGTSGPYGLGVNVSVE